MTDKVSHYKVWIYREVNGRKLGATKTFPNVDEHPEASYTGITKEEALEVGDKVVEITTLTTILKSGKQNRMKGGKYANNNIWRQKEVP